MGTKKAMGMRQQIADIRGVLGLLGESPKGDITDFKRQRQEGARLLLKGAIQQMVEETKGTDAEGLARKLAQATPSEMPAILEKLAQVVADVQTETSIKPNLIPGDVRSEILADLSEIQSCMNAGCYRSAIILCGRVMETALHRKYYEATGQDLLEKAPGIGLGNLIAKLSEKGVKLDPGLTNQIHLINQVRVFSVHTKQDAFIPSKMQAQAIVLYTIDILEKVFQ